MPYAFHSRVVDLGFLAGRPACQRAGRNKNTFWLHFTLVCFRKHLQNHPFDLPFTSASWRSGAICWPWIFFLRLQVMLPNNGQASALELGYSDDTSARKVWIDWLIDWLIIYQCYPTSSQQRTCSTFNLGRLTLLCDRTTYKQDVKPKSIT